MTVSGTAARELGAADLKFGDILLCNDPTGKLAAWVQCADGKGTYHHAALYVGDANNAQPLIHATPQGGVGRVSLDALLGRMQFIDVFRLRRRKGTVVDRRKVAARAVGLLGARYDFMVIPHFITLFKKDCHYPVAATWEFLKKLVKDQMSAAPAPTGVPALMPKLWTKTTCSQFIVLCYQPYLNSLVEEAGARLTRLANGETLASLAADQVSGPILRAFAPIAVSAEGPEEIPAEGPEAIPQELVDALADLASALYPDSGPVTFVGGAGGPDVARMLGIMDRRAALRRLHNETSSFVSPGDLSRSGMTRLVGRIPGTAKP